MENGKDIGKKNNNRKNKKLKQKLSITNRKKW